MDLDFLTPLYERPGPVASVYLDTTRATEDAAHRIQVRWEQQRRELAEAGADDATLRALDGVVGQDRGVPGEHGQAVFAAGGSVLFEHTLPHPPRRELVAWAPLPHAMPLVRELADSVPYVVVLADRVGADITAYGENHDAEIDARIDGNDFDIRRVKPGGWSQRRYQESARNAWEQNAEPVAARVGRIARGVQARVIVVAGDTRARVLVQEHLPKDVSDLAVDVAEGGRAADGDDASLWRRVQQLVAEASAREVLEVVEEFAQERGQHDRAVDGLAATVGALRRAQVQTLLLVDDPTSTETLWVGPDPTLLGTDRQELADLGVDDPVEARADAALLRALAGTGAGFVVVPGGDTTPADGVGAVLRYADPSTPA